MVHGSYRVTHGKQYQTCRFLLAQVVRHLEWRSRCHQTSTTELHIFTKTQTKSLLKKVVGLFILTDGYI